MAQSSREGLGDACVGTFHAQSTKVAVDSEEERAKVREEERESVCVCVCLWVSEQQRT